jgi:predicted lipoprotein with Yx(FWY)xxD motif
MDRFWAGVGIAVAAVLPMTAGEAQQRNQLELEDYVREPIPAGFQVTHVEIEGPVFADTGGKTLYIWPLNGLRNGDAGERKGAPTCDDTVYKLSAGLTSPYPGNLTLPGGDARTSCVQNWPPVFAGDDAKPVGRWTVVTRKDGRKQWAYDGMALYTSVLDQKPGDAIGGTKRTFGGNGYSLGARRVPAAPPTNLPPQFKINHIDGGRLLVTAAADESIYVSDKDSATKSNCDAKCRQEFQPILAPEHVQPQGEWSIIESSPGLNQWTFRGKPLYTRLTDTIPHSLEGSDVPGWRNVWTQKEPPPPRGFTVQRNHAGDVLADDQGRTIYVYHCQEDAIDQPDCSHPAHFQVYRFAVSGKGDPKTAVQNFPYVIAGANAKSDSHVWSVIHIDPMTGGKAAAGQKDALRVWAYRDRPVYLCVLDKAPGDIECDAWGEFTGLRNGYRALWVRDAFGGMHSGLR